MELNTVKDHHREHIWISKIRKYLAENICYSGNWFGDSLSACANSRAFKETATSNKDGFQRGVKDADLQNQYEEQL